MNLAKPYNRPDFLDFLKEFLPDFEKDIAPVNLVHNFKTISSATYLGHSNTLDVDVYEFKAIGKSHKKVSQAIESFKVAKQQMSFKSLIVYYSTEDENWRFALLQMTPDQSESGKIVTKISNPRRYSFLLGPQAKVRTPEKYLVKDGAVKDFEDLQRRFSVEVVNKDFYKEISRFFIRLVGGDTKLGSKTEHFKPELNLPSIDPNDHKTYQEYTVRLIGRVIFCWFLKQKKSQEGISLLPEEFLSSEAVKNTADYYHTTLEPIFFEVLNKPIESRRPPFRSSFDKIPYLNGGLFDPHYDDFYEGQPSFALKIPNDWFRELFEVLETYNFTIDENTSLDVDLSIDPEMLGRIFENLLAEINPETGESARKSTGSYYTPRQIVEYMVDQSLIQYLISKTEIAKEKIDALVSVDASDDEEFPLSDEDKKKVINALDEVKIIDPACGSGAFPIGILQKIVWILGKVDMSGKLWFDKKLEGLDPLLHEDFKLKFENENFDYIRKIGVIRDSIYGVDIQPIAVEVSKLRSFLTLIVDEEVDDNKNNRAIKPLPNLEFKFIAANTLISPPEENNLFGESDPFFLKLNSLCSEYFYESDRATKLELKSKINELINNKVEEHFKHIMNISIYAGDYRFNKALQDKKSEEIEKISYQQELWKSYKNIFSFKTVKFFDSKYFFPDVKHGFNIVIANPPYVGYNEGAKQGQDLFSCISKKRISLNNYCKFNLHSIPSNPKKYAPKPNLYSFFIAKGTSLLGDDGVFSFIIPQTILIAGDLDVLRYSLSNMFSVNKIVTFNNKIFNRKESGGNDVATSSLLLFMQNKSTNDATEIIISKDEQFSKTETKQFSCQTLRANVRNWAFFGWSNPVSSLIDKIINNSRDCSAYYDHEKSEAEFGDSFYFDKGLVFLKDKIIPEESASGEYYYQAKLSKAKYSVELTGNVIEIDHIKFPHGSQGKIVLSKKYKVCWSYMNFDHFYFSDKNILLDFNNVIISSDNRTEILFLFALLNSKLVKFLFNKYLKIGSEKNILLGIKAIKEYFRVPSNISRDDKEELTYIAEKIIENSNSEIIGLLDKKVYEIFNISEDEISIIKEDDV